MSIKKQENGSYLLNFRPNGVKGKQVKITRKTKQECLNLQKSILSEGSSGQKRDIRTLLQLIQLWFDSHGMSLKSAIDTKNRLNFIAQSLNNPVAQTLNPELFIKYRSQRLNSGLSPATLNREYSTLSAMFNELERMGFIKYKNPLIHIRKLKVIPTELGYLTQDEIKFLYASIEKSSNYSLFYVVQICLSTGARWGEAERIKSKNLKNGGVEFLDTKNGKNRFVPLSVQVHLDLTNYLNHHKKFDSCYSAFRSALKRSGIVTAAGQSAHILRHTFASHFIMNGGNILTLQKILGHSSLNVTTRYSHLAPDFLQEAIIYNPLEFNKKDT